MTTSGLELRPTGAVEPLGPRALALAAVGVGGFGLAAIYQLSKGHVGIPCPLHLATGLDCPLCGSTRMASALLHGDLAGAWHFNAAVLVMGSLIGVALSCQTVAWSLERARLVRLPRLRLEPRMIRLLTTVAVVTLLVFGVLRNL
jgi:hypothetical protein